MPENRVAIDTINGSFGTTIGTSVPGPNLGAGLMVATGTLIGGTTLTTATTGAGSTVDLGTARTTVTLVVTASAGVSAGVVAIELSHDSTNWFRSATTITTSAPGVSQVTNTGAFRYARANITTNITGGTVSATIMGS